VFRRPCSYIRIVGSGAINWKNHKARSTLSRVNGKFCYTCPVPVSVGAKLYFVDPGRRWAHSPFPSKAPGISYQGTMKTSGWIGSILSPGTHTGCYICPGGTSSVQAAAKPQAKSATVKSATVTPAFVLPGIGRGSAKPPGMH